MALNDTLIRQIKHKGAFNDEKYATTITACLGEEVRGMLDACSKTDAKVMCDLLENAKRNARDSKTTENLVVTATRACQSASICQPTR